MVGRKEMFRNIAGQSMTFVHSDLYLSTHVSKVAPASTSVSEDTNFSDRPWVTVREQTQGILAS